MNHFSYKNQIFNNKTELMAVAIILIMCYHAEFGDLITHIRPLYFIKELCDIGVEIFLLLSGFSLAVSFTKDTNLVRFYKKRLLRILPPYFITFGLWYAFIWCKDSGSFCEYLWDLFFLNYYIDNDLLIWFVPVILLYYLILPFYILLLRKNSIYRLIPLIVIVLDVVLKSNNIDPRFTLLRLPIFLIGANLFFENQETKCLSIKEFLFSWPFLALVSVLSLAFSYYFMFMVERQYGYKYIAYIPLALIIVKSYKSISKIKSLLAWLGVITLEVYLLHERIQWVVSAVQVKIFPQVPIWIVGVVSIFITLPLAYYLNKFIKCLLSR